tara:strand:+ start:390 stop:914 length:525 start_codon:yes stop_codon:yes gene_type:complete
MKKRLALLTLCFFSSFIVGCDGGNGGNEDLSKSFEKDKDQTKTNLEKCLTTFKNSEWKVNARYSANLRAIVNKQGEIIKIKAFKNSDGYWKECTYMSSYTLLPVYAPKTKIKKTKINKVYNINDGYPFHPWKAQIKIEGNQMILYGIPENKNYEAFRKVYAEKNSWDGRDTSGK